MRKISGHAMGRISLNKRNPKLYGMEIEFGSWINKNIGKETFSIMNMIKPQSKVHQTSPIIFILFLL